MVNIKREELVNAFREAIRYRAKELKEYPNMNTSEIFFMLGYLSSMLYKNKKTQDKFIDDCQKETY